jgi:hypothetical protein
MGRPIQKKWFGDPDSAGYQLRVTAKLPGETVAEGFIVEQKGTRKYKVNIGGVIGDVYLINETDGAELTDGQGFMVATPFGGAALPVYKLTQFRVSLYDGAGVSTHTWSQNAAALAGVADVLNDAVVASISALGSVDSTGGVVDTLTIINAGSGYIVAPTVTITDPEPTATGATATATISNGVVDSLTIDNGGTNYTDGQVEVSIQSPEVANA